MLLLHLAIVLVGCAITIQPNTFPLADPHGRTSTMSFEGSVFEEASLTPYVDVPDGQAQTSEKTSNYILTIFFLYVLVPLIIVVIFVSIFLIVYFYCMPRCAQMRAINRVRRYLRECTRRLDQDGVSTSSYRRSNRASDILGSNNDFCMVNLRDRRSRARRRSSLRDTLRQSFEYRSFLSGRRAEEAQPQEGNPMVENENIQPATNDQMDSNIGEGRSNADVPRASFVQVSSMHEQNPDVDPYAVVDITYGVPTPAPSTAGTIDRPHSSCSSMFTILDRRFDGSFMNQNHGAMSAPSNAHSAGPRSRNSMNTMIKIENETARKSSSAGYGTGSLTDGSPFRSVMSTNQKSGKDMKSHRSAMGQQDAGKTTIRCNANQPGMYYEEPRYENTGALLTSVNKEIQRSMDHMNQLEQESEESIYAETSRYYIGPPISRDEAVYMRNERLERLHHLPDPEYAARLYSGIRYYPNPYATEVLLPAGNGLRSSFRNRVSRPGFQEGPQEISNIQGMRYAPYPFETQFRNDLPAPGLGTSSRRSAFNPGWSYAPNPYARESELMIPVDSLYSLPVDIPLNDLSEIKYAEDPYATPLQLDLPPPRFRSSYRKNPRRRKSEVAQRPLKTMGSIKRRDTSKMTKIWIPGNTANQGHTTLQRAGSMSKPPRKYPPGQNTMKSGSNKKYYAPNCLPKPKLIPFKPIEIAALTPTPKDAIRKPKPKHAENASKTKRPMENTEPLYAEASPKRHPMDLAKPEYAENASKNERSMENTEPIYAEISPKRKPKMHLAKAECSTAGLHAATTEKKKVVAHLSASLPVKKPEAERAETLTKSSQPMENLMNERSPNCLPEAQSKQRRNSVTHFALSLLQESPEAEQFANSLNANVQMGISGGEKPSSPKATEVEGKDSSAKKDDPETTSL